MVRAQGEAEVSTKFSAEFKDFAKYLFFLSVFCAVIFGPKNSDPYYMRQSLDDMFLGNEYDYGASYRDTASLAQVWQWVDTIVLPNLYPEVWYNDNERPKEDRRTVTDGSGYRIGLARLRAVRVKDSGCQVSQHFQHATSSCYPQYSCGMLSSTQDTAPWQNPKPRNADWTNPGLPEVDHREIPFVSTAESAFYSTETTITYCSGGQVVDLSDSFANASAQVLALKNSTWIDRSTRALFVEFNLYNPNTDLFAVFRAVVEFLPSGHIVPSYSIICLPLLRPARVYRALAVGDDFTTKTTAALTVLEAILYVYILVLLWFELRELCKYGWRAYIASGWKKLDVLNLSLFVGVIGLRVFNVYQTMVLAGGDPGLATTTTFVEELTSIADYAKLVENLNALNAAISFLKVFKYVRYNKKLSQFIDTVVLTCKEVGSLMGIIVVIIAAYATAFNLGYGSELSSYRDFASSVFTLFKSMLGDFELDELFNGTNRVLGSLLFTTFVPLMFFVILSMFLAIVDTSYETVRSRLAEIDGEADHQFNDDVAFVIGFPRRLLKSASQKFIEKLYAMEKLAPLVEEEEEELGVESKEETSLADNLADVVENDPEVQDPVVANVELYRRALAILEDLRENQDKLETMLDETSGKLAPPSTDGTGGG